MEALLSMRAENLTLPPGGHAPVLADRLARPVPAFGLAPAWPSRAGVQALSPWLLCCLDAVDYGVMVVRSDAQLLFANAAAREVLAECSPLRCAADTLLATDDTQDEALQEALHTAAHRGLRRLVRLGKGKGSLRAAVLPLEPTAGGPSGACMVLLSRRDTCGALSLQWFASAHNLTPAESRVLQGLAQGQEPREIASTYGVGLATVRTQIGSIRAKVGVDSIRELLSQLGTLPPMLPALRGGLC